MRPINKPFTSGILNRIVNFSPYSQARLLFGDSISRHQQLHAVNEMTLLQKVHRKKVDIIFPNGGSSTYMNIHVPLDIRATQVTTAQPACCCVENVKYMSSSTAEQQNGGTQIGS